MYFTIALVTTAKIWKQPKFPLTEEWVKIKKKMYMMDYSVQFSRSVVSDSL